MGSTRALFASIGVSVSLVAAAALSLFTVSVVIAFGGWSAGLGESAPPSALVIAGTTTTESESHASPRGAAPVVLRAPAHRRARHVAAAPVPVAPAPTPRLAAARVRHPVVTHAPDRPQPVQAPLGETPTPTPTPAAAKHVPPAGDAVRRLGDGLSSGVESTGKALGDATAPLVPPVSSAVEKVLDAVAEVLQRTTNGLGGALDKLGKR
jgi:hypothetical protein